MNKNISNTLHLLTIFFTLFCTYTPIQAQFLNSSNGLGQMIAPNGQILDISFAVNDTERTKGLSSLAKDRMQMNEGLLFIFKEAADKVFWMPDTHFDLDIIFLDSNMKVVGIDEAVKHFPKKQPEAIIPRTNKYFCQFVLELHAFQAKKYEIKVGSILKWKKHPEIPIL